MGEGWHFATLADAEGDGEQVEGPSVLGKEEQQQREGLQGHAHNPHCPAAPALRRHRHDTPRDDPNALLRRQHSGGHSQGQAAVNGDGNHQDVDDVVAHAAPVVDADEVPEGDGALRLLDEHRGPYLCRLVLFRPLYRFLPEVAPRTQANLGRAVVKEPDHQEQQRPARNARKPENPLHPKLVEGRANQEQQGDGASPLERPHHPHGRPQVPPEPQGYARHRKHREDGGGDAQHHAEEQVELPQAAHDARQHHARNEQQGPQEQELADAVAVSQPSHVGADQSQDYPVQAEGKADCAVAPAEPGGGIAQVRHQRGGGEPHRRGDEPHSRGDSHDDPSVVNLPAREHRKPFSRRGLPTICPPETVCQQALVMPSQSVIPAKAGIHRVPGRQN